MSAAARCAVHPSRPAASRCPRCDRPRCAADAAGLPYACLACTTVEHHPRPDGAPRQRRVRPVDALVRAGAAAVPATAIGALVCSQYVDAGIYAYVTPLLAAVVAAAAIRRASGVPDGDPLLRLVRALGVLAALLIVAGGFRLVPGGLAVLTPLDRVTGPYLLAVAGALFATAPAPSVGRAVRRRDAARG